MQQLYSLTARYLYAICQRYLSNEEDTKDVLQETFVKIFRNIKEFNERNDATLLSWMVRIAVNESLMFLRQKRRETFIESHSDIPDKEEELEVARFTAEELHNAHGPEGRRCLAKQLKPVGLLFFEGLLEPVVFGIFFRGHFLHLG